MGKGSRIAEPRRIRHLLDGDHQSRDDGDMSRDVLIRPLLPSDLPQLQALAEHLDTLNLPRDPTVLAALAADSGHAFAALAGGPVPKRPAYTLVAVLDDRLVGTASLFAEHGTLDDPHYYLRVDEQIVHSAQLQTDRRRTVLRLGKDVEPWSEFGGLIVHPEARGQGLGTLLVASRLLLVAMHRKAFARRLLAELLPPRREDGGNAFWDHVGRPLTGLDYYRADLLCRSDKEFIDAFFPHEELVADLLPASARELIGKEGPQTTPVRALLRRAGFQWLGTIDPFDAGPHDGAEVESIRPITRSRRAVRLESAPTAPIRLLVGACSGHRFAALDVEPVDQGLRLTAVDAQRLGLAIGGECWTMPLDW